ncbi:MAG: hypothetical protein GF344_08660 [Chitinivibrionales bacterium]|nr:hypothetical protein [Chitinivibrionales bacterium]MBD3356944.1 hypothetical protein [Chitinivibrionales bacterium]
MPPHLSEKVDFGAWDYSTPPSMSCSMFWLLPPYWCGGFVPKRFKKCGRCMMLVRLDGHSVEARRVFCIGQNYAAHITEMKSETPDSPVIFSKPSTSLVLPGTKIPFPGHGNELHYEAEVVVMVGTEGRPEHRDDARRFVGGVSLGLDLTMRDLQKELRARGLPWETAKAFDYSAPVGEFTSDLGESGLANISFTLRVNGEVRQKGNTGRMIFDIPTILLAIGRVWTLLPGDIVFTGTPEGVGALSRGDRAVVESPVIGKFEWEIAVGCEA